MKLFWYCASAVLIAVAHAAVDVEKTVQQVQKILKSNTLLPRLTREEIIDLLNDIKAEDAKSTSTSREKSSEIILTPTTTSTTTTTTSSTTTPTLTTTSTPGSTIYNKNIEENEVFTVFQTPEKEENIALEEIDVASDTNTVESTTKHSGKTLTVVLPYTPRDGSSLQELYTRPPRLEIVPEKVTPKPVKTAKSIKHEDNLKDILTTNSKIASIEKIELPAELQAFLDSHGLKGNSGKDHFLLPLEGFKPLPPGKIVDGTVQLPENILLTYDLISPSDLPSTANERVPAYSNDNYLYEPLRPEYPYELDTASSETKHSVLPLDLPKPRKPKAVENPQPNYEPIDYDSIKVIPLNQGPNPINDESVIQNEQNKRQTNTSDSFETDTTTITPTTTGSSAESDSKSAVTTTTVAPDNVPADSDSGASIADLEDSFGGAAPVQPGDSVLPPPKKNGFYWMVDWNSFLEVGDGDSKVNIRFEPKLGDPQMFLPVNVP